jgi:ribosome-associated protein
LPDAIDVTPRVTVPASAIRMSVSRSSGPGGQNVNKVSSKVELRVDLAQVTGLSADARARLAVLTENRRDAEGLLLVVSQRTRDQSRNLEDAREKVSEVIRRALVAPKKRRPTRPGKAAKERRIAGKKLRGATKAARGRGGWDE